MASRDPSPLSSIDTADDSDRDSVKNESRAQSPSAVNMPPSKRRRTGVASWDRHTPMSTLQDDIPPPASPSSSISSDTSGEIPNSPVLFGAALGGNTQEDDYSGQCSDQVTVCMWDGCTAGDLGNMDGLVQHIHNDHIGTRQKRYSCEWMDCSRKGQTHASAYALRAHMRSHTREKPFYCTLPECDRNFTRSDALTKHMRSVHELDSLRPTEVKAAALGSAAGATGTPVAKLQRIRLKLSQPSRDHGSDAETVNESLSTTATGHDDTEDASLSEFGPELGFDKRELAMAPRDLYRLLRRQIHWAENETAQLKSLWDQLRPKREQAWLEKEAIFDDVIDAELRLFSALVGDLGPIPTGTDSSVTSLEKLQQQQMQFKHQQDQLQAKPTEQPDDDVDGAA
ncbi:hypothetical protein N7539_004200 [Penicillium diatomitis]|uniref:C2H2-type domain-containing protein n=1 Tax=Penicillium diatomitis TaxID=2819901 RepID=A0A9X0BY11_9EURO|nr:uncharacterized protein N7539_004200 [Penicillium diatomitis]KAJ5489310.1 hypothetical protein N7539_004200 [Penicillium diatomitis]